MSVYDLIMPEKSKSAVLFLRLGLQSTLIRHEDGAFRKRSSNRRNLKKPVLRFIVRGKHFETKLFKNYEVAIIMMFSSKEFSSNTNTECNGDCCVFIFLQRSKLV